MADHRYFTGSERKKREDGVVHSAYGMLSDFQDDEDQIIGYPDLHHDSQIAGFEEVAIQDPTTGDDVDAMETDVEPSEDEEVEDSAEGDDSVGGMVVASDTWYYNDALLQASATNEFYKSGTAKKVKMRKTNFPWTTYYKNYIWKWEGWSRTRTLKDSRGKTYTKLYSVYSWRWVGDS